MHRSKSSPLMSAMGQKQTCAAQKVMSALPPKADMAPQNRKTALRGLPEIQSDIFDRSSDRCGLPLCFI